MIFWFGFSAIGAAFAFVYYIASSGPPLEVARTKAASAVQSPSRDAPKATAMAAMWPNDVVQHSTVAALMAGFAKDGPSAAQLAGYGTHGIGTFAAMDGEMVFIDRKAYQFTSDGNVRLAPANVPLPFVQVTKFVPEYNLTVPRTWSKPELMDLFAYGGPEAGGPNSFIAVSIKGLFKTIAVRVAGPQESPDQPLAEVAANAKQWDLHNVAGTMFGFVSPQWAQGISVAGPHLHFLSDERRGEVLQGGHVRNFEAEAGASLQWAVSGHHHLGLPRGKKWESLDMSTDSTGIAEAEG